jgi:glycosyltransferase involved in cell wall biosynthesis
MGSVLTVAVHPSADLYGSDRVFADSVTALEDPVRVILPSEGPLVHILRERGIPVDQQPFPVIRKTDLRSPVSVLRFAGSLLLSVITLARQLKRMGKGVVYLSTIVAPVWIFAGRLAGWRVICHVHENEEKMPVMASWTLLWPLRLAHVVIANSQATSLWIQRATSKQVAHRTSVVYNAVREPTGTVDRPLRPPTHRHAVVVGRLNYRKGQDVAIRAIALLRQRGYDIGLSIIGDCYPGNEHFLADYQRLSVALRVDKYISFEGFQEAFPYLSQADIVVVPSRVESFGLAAAEALALGKPTVATRVGGLPEVIDHGRTGLLVASGAAEELADSIGQLLDDPQLAMQLSQEAKRDAATRFSAAAYEKRFRLVVAAAGKGPECSTGADTDQSQ